MAQTLKPELRQRVLDAAEQVFAEAGYLGATMASIAGRAGMSTGNLYRYFANKDALFYEIFSEGFATRFLGLVHKRVLSLTESRDLTRLDAKAARDADELLRFWIDHRLKVITILQRAEGSRYEGFAERFIEQLMRPTLLKLKADAGRRLVPSAQTVLRSIFENTVRTIVAILETHSDEAQIRHAFAGFWSYQLAGLAGFNKWAIA